MLQDLDVDVCGFREGILITGARASSGNGSGASAVGASTQTWRHESAASASSNMLQSSCQPLLVGCRVRCSGDDGIHISGDASPLLHRCEVLVRAAKWLPFALLQAGATAGGNLRMQSCSCA